MFRAPPNFFGGFDFFSVVSNNRQHVASRAEIGRLVGGSALKPGLPPAGADGSMFPRGLYIMRTLHPKLGEPSTVGGLYIRIRIVQCSLGDSTL